MVASSVDVEKEQSVAARQEVNAGSYVSFHNAQMFEDGFSFSGFERNKVWINTGRSMADLSDVSGADSPNDSRAVLAADFDDDGDLDLFVHNIQRERHALYRNDIPGADARYLKLRLMGTSGQWEAIGATVTVTTPAGPVSQVHARGSGFLSCQPRELVFGLGAAESAETIVRWPGGGLESFGELAAGSSLLLVEGEGEAVAVPRRPGALPDPLPPGLAVEEGDLLPKLHVRDAQGADTVLDVAALGGGERVLLNLWASYCAPCVKELPLLQERHASGEVVVIALSMDVPADQETARALLEAAGASFPSFYLPEGSSAPEGASAIDALIDLERLTLPTTLGLDPQGRLETILRGPLREGRD